MSYNIAINNPDQQGQVLSVYGPTRNLQELLNLMPDFLLPNDERWQDHTPLFIVRIEQGKTTILWRWHPVHKTWVRKVWELK